MYKRIFTLYNDRVQCAVVVEASVDNKTDWRKADFLMEEAIGDLTSLSAVRSAVAAFPAKLPDLALRKAIVYENWRDVVGVNSDNTYNAFGGAQVGYKVTVPKHTTIDFNQMAEA